MSVFKFIGKVCTALAMTFLTVTSFAQDAENLNLHTPRTEPYLCYGRLADGCPNAEKLGWKVGIQGYTFTKYTFFEAIDLTKALGLDYIEASMGLRVSPDSQVRIGTGMPQEWKDKIKKRLVESGIRSVSIYAWMDGTGSNFEELVKFCKEMGFTTIVTDPKRAVNGGKDVKFYEDILDQYGLTMVFTNHPKDAAYWNPDFTLEDVKDAGKSIGASIDFGHYMRGGFDPCEIARRYADTGKMYHFHLRDVSMIGPHGLDVPCGEGAGRVDEVFQMLFDRNIEPLIMIEYEHDFDNPMPYLIKTVNWINEKCGEMIAARQKAAQTGAEVVLHAADATLSEGLRLQGNGDAATIHDWNSARQSITWKADLKAGNYQVRMRYAQPGFGSAMTVTAGDQELAYLFEPTFTWNDYRTNYVGVISIPAGGETEITLRGIQLAMKADSSAVSKFKAVEALPDVSCIELIPTTLKADSQPVNIIDSFQGESIFDGKTLAGWEYNSESAKEHFRISKGAIVGGNMKDDLAHNQFVRTQKTYRDFELHLKYMVKAYDKNYNGGVQFRSVHCEDPERDFEMVGYQGDIISWKHGPLYDESRRWDFLGEQLYRPEEYHVDKWNDYVIRCEGPRTRIWVNGVKTADYIDPYWDKNYPGIGEIFKEGYIAVQIHEGRASEVWYKDIKVQEL